MKGWKYEGYRHSLASKGIKTRVKPMSLYAGMHEESLAKVYINTDTGAEVARVEADGTGELLVSNEELDKLSKEGKIAVKGHHHMHRGVSKKEEVPKKEEYDTIFEVATYSGKQIF
jgi:hypothetical protein